MKPKEPLAKCNYGKIGSIGNHLSKSKSLVISKQTNRGTSNKLLFLAKFVRKLANQTLGMEFRI